MPDRPNVIIVMTDQQRADVCRREGYALDTTPFLDELGATGVWFNRAYSAMPACIPARVSMLTGRYASATRVRSNHNVEDASYTHDLFDVFRAAGYRTAMVGKNHSHLRSERVDFWFGAGHCSAPDHAENPQYANFDALLGQMKMHLRVEPTPFPPECQLPHRSVTQAMRWIESGSARRGGDGSGADSSQPFMMWLSFAEPHNPYQVSEPYYSMFPPEALPPARSGPEALAVKGFPYQWCRQSFERAFPDYITTVNRARANYHGMLRLIDDQVRRLFEFLDQASLRENTIVVFLSDHGDFVGEYGLLRKGPELPEALIRIPLIVTGPGIIPGNGTPHAAHVSIVDLMPTLCEVIGSPIPEGVQGRSLWPLLTGGFCDPGRFASAYAEQGFGGAAYDGSESLDPAQDGLTVSPDGRTWGAFDCLNSWTQSGTMRMVRKGDWKLVYDAEGRGQLYDLSKDPSELDNLFGRAEVTPRQSELMAELMRWTLRAQDPLPHPRRRYVFKSRG